MRAGFELGIREDLARGFEPVLREGGLQPHGERAGYLDHGVAGRQRWRVAEPVVGHADTADKATAPSTTSRSRCVRLLRRFSVYQAIGLVPAYASPRRAARRSSASG